MASRKRPYTWNEVKPGDIISFKYKIPIFTDWDFFTFKIPLLFLFSLKQKDHLVHKKYTS